MRFNQKNLAKHGTLDEVLGDIYSPEEVLKIDAAAERRARIRRGLSDQVSKALAAYMAREDIGFNELERRLHMSSATTSKLLKGEANITLETIAAVSLVIDQDPDLRWSSAK